MKYLKAYESNDWMKKTNDPKIQDIAYQLDDILLDIKDEGFPYIQDSFITTVGKIDAIQRDAIEIEIGPTDDGKLINDYDGKFLTCKITPLVKSSIDRIYQYITDSKYSIEIGLHIQEEGKDQYDDETFIINKDISIDVKNSNWVVRDYKKYNHFIEINDLKTKEYMKGEVLNIENINPYFISIQIVI
jgi:hypothetical protein